MEASARLFVLGYLGATSVLPFLALLLVSFQGFWTPQVDFGALTGDNYVDLWNRLSVRRGITNSLLLALMTATITTLLSALLAYLSYRRRSFLGRVVDGVIKVPAAISHIVVTPSWWPSLVPLPLERTLLLWSPPMW